MSELKDAIGTLTNLGKQVIEAIDNDEFPLLEIPDRSTSKIIFDRENRQFVLSGSKTIRDSSNIKHVRSFAQLVWIAFFAKTLLESGRTSSLRDIYWLRTNDCRPNRF